MARTAIARSLRKRRTCSWKWREVSILSRGSRREGAPSAACPASDREGLASGTPPSPGEVGGSGGDGELKGSGRLRGGGGSCSATGEGHGDGGGPPNCPRGGNAAWRAAASRPPARRPFWRAQLGSTRRARMAPPRPRLFAAQASRALFATHTWVPHATSPHPVARLRSFPCR